MSTAGARLPADDRVGGRYGQAFQVVWTIFAVCVGTVVYALLFLAGTLFGFALAFGGGVIALECVAVARGISRRGQSRADDWGVPV